MARLSLKNAGDMRLARDENRRRFLISLGIDPARAYFLKQVHSKKVLIAEDLTRNRERALYPAPDYCPAPDSYPTPDSYPAPDYCPDGDGLVTGKRESVLCVTVADCLPIFLYDPVSGAFGLLHSGWKGTGIVIPAVRLMEERFDTDPSRLHATLGPCIGSCCYRVPEERYSFFRHEFGEKAARSDGGGYYLDLQAANRTLLEELGVKEITAVRDCTSCNRALSSFRRDGPEGFSLMLAVLSYRIS